MSAFKDAVKADLKGVFINLDEFADVHLINGEKVEAVIDRDVLKERPNLTTSTEAKAIFAEEIHIYVAYDDLPKKPVKGQILDLDGTIYLVQEVHENMGILEITIAANHNEGRR